MDATNGLKETADDELAHIRRTDSISKRKTTMTTKGKVLVLVSSGHGLPLKDGKVYTGAGYYLNELTVPVRALMNEGYEITFANPKGNTPQMDVHSAVADDRKSTRLNSSHMSISYAVFCLKKKS